MADNKGYPLPTNPGPQPGYQAPPGYQQQQVPATGYQQQQTPAYQPPCSYQRIPPPPTGSSSSSSVLVVQGRGAGTTVVQHTNTNYGSPQAVVVQTKPAQPVKVRTQGGLFGDLEKAFDTAAKDLSKIADSATHSVVNPSDILRSGNKILIQSITSGQYLRVSDKGLLEVSQDKGPRAQFVVARAAQYPASVKFANASRPSSYIAIQNGYAVGYGSGGVDCDFTPYVYPDWTVTLESVISPGSHLGVLPSGQLTAPAQTTKETDASHFKMFFLGV